MRAALVFFAACSYAPPSDLTPPAVDSSPVDSEVDDAPPDAPLDAAPAKPISLIRVKSAQHPDALHDDISVDLKNQEAGDANVIVVSWLTPTTTLVSLTDTEGNVYVKAGEATNGTIVQQTFVAVPITTSPSNTVTAQFSSTAAFCDLRALEFAGIATTGTIDQIASATGTSATPSVGPVVTSYDNVTLLGIFSGSVSGQGQGWVQRFSVGGRFIEEKRPGVIGSFTATATGSSAPFVAQLIALRGAQ